MGAIDTDAGAWKIQTISLYCNVLLPSLLTAAFWREVVEILTCKALFTRKQKRP